MVLRSSEATFRNETEAVNGYTLGFAVSVPIVIGIVTAAFAAAWWSYRRTAPPISSARRWSLITLRTIGIGLLLLLVLEPILSHTGVRIDSPSVLVAVDESASMRLQGLDSMRSHEAVPIVAMLKRSFGADHLHWLGFGDSTYPIHFPLNGDTLRSDRVVTRLDLPFLRAADSMRHHNVRAVLLLTDGRFTAGASPLYEAEELGLPVYLVGLGDSVNPPDVSVQSILTNEVTYTGNEIPVEVRVRSSGPSTTVTSVSLNANGTPVATRSLAIPAGDHEEVVTFSFRAASEGVVRLRAEVRAVAGELTPNNNARSTFVKVRSDRRKYLLIAGGPGADVAFIRRKLERDKAITVVSYIGRGDGSFIEGDLSAASFNGVEAVILVDFPTSSTNDGALRTLRNALGSREISLLFIAGNRLDPARLKLLEPFLPFTVGSSRSGEMEVVAHLESAGRESPVTRVPQVDRWNDLPSIYRSETTFEPRIEASSLISWGLPGSPMREPLIVTRSLGSRRSIAVLGYGIFRWELLAGGMRNPGSDSVPSVLEGFVSNSLRWLAASDNERRVRIAAEKRLYGTDETIRIAGQVYDESYEPLSDARVSATVQGPDGEERVTLAPMGNGQYQATLGRRAPGEYSVVGVASMGNRDIGRDASAFSVGDLGPEFAEPSLNAELLRALASRTGGVFRTSREAASIVDDIRKNSSFEPRTIAEDRDTPLWQVPWILAAALAAFALEWFIRKRSGLV